MNERGPFYRRWFVRAFWTAWAATALFIAVLTIIFRFYLETHPQWASTMNHLLWVVPTIIFAGIGVWAIFEVPYRLHREDMREVEALTQRKLEILFENTNDYVFERPTDPNMAGPTERLFKVAVRNCSGKTVENVSLSLVDMAPRPPNSPFPLPLHAMHEQIGPSSPVYTGVQYGGLNPNAPRFFDVIQMTENGQAWMQMYTIAPYGFGFPRGRHVLTLRAEGQDATSDQRSFVTEVDANGKLCFYPC